MFLEIKGWASQLEPLKENLEIQKLKSFIDKEYQESIIFPPQHQLFEALQKTSFDAVKVVILGQDPYHGEGQANGLSFSVHPGVKIPPSLRNIYQELVEDVGCSQPTQGDLSSWATQGVLLLNTVLTVRKGQAHSHRAKGWEQLTDFIIAQLNEREEPIVFILWGAAAQKKAKQIDQQKHACLLGPHPSPLSAYRGFFGSRPFTRANQYLVQWGQTPIDWCSVSRDGGKD